MIKWNLETISLKLIKPNPKNPRKISKEQQQHLQNLIEKFGLIDKPILNKDLSLIGGHQRIKILKKMKEKEVECWVPDVQLEQEDIDHLCVGLNLNQGSFDYDILANEFDALKLLEWGFTEEQLIGSFKEIEEITSTEEESEILEPAKDEDAITKPGDLYELGDHRLICGDSTMPEVVEKVLNGETPILMVTDPPYGVNYDPNWRSKAGKGQKAAGRVQNDDKVNWALAWHLFPGSVAYVWCASWYLPEVAQDLNDAEFERKSLIIWAKQHFSLSRGDYHWQHEPCWYAIKKEHQHNWQGSRKESTLWEISSQNAFGSSKEEDERTSHSTQKPLECMARPIRNNTAKAEGVYDPFLGSGTTLIASEKLNRKCYGIEISPAYCDIIVKRWVNFRKKNEKSFRVIRNGLEIEEF